MLGKILLLLSLATLVFVGPFAFYRNAAAVTESGDITVSGTIPTPPPQDAPTIDQPKNDATFNQKNITISGQCTAGLTVRIFSNNIFVGSTVCQDDDTYSLRADLFLARNDLVARQYDTLNQSSPDSNQITVYYSAPRPTVPGDDSQQPPSVAHFQLVIDYDYTVQSIFAGQAFLLPIQFRGGTAPYVVTIDWGEGSSNSFNRNNTNGFDTSFIYEKPGTYIVGIRVQDSAGQEAYLQFVLIVNGEPGPVDVTKIASREVTTDLTVLVGSVCLGLILVSFIAGKYSVKKRKKVVDN